ncbi:hypothetical protein [Marinicella meishanensis]|uniref:hypothetical protein n=1 Tax=Marinicella meishanensis TaxID=2873263 RepID=UPI001CBC4F0E|nr:hypothetical protein [Marinicella sp. NBU2979]
MKTLIHWLLAWLLAWPLLGTAQYRQDLPPVMNPDQEPSTTASQRYASPALGEQYRQMGSPKILLLLGRRLGSDLSEWQADTRDTITTMNRAYQGSHQAKDTRDTHRMTENRQVIQVNVTPGMRAFYQGFTDYMQAANMGMVNYDSIVRQAQRQNELSGTIDRSTDLREVEADAIMQQVDVLVEILDAGSITVLGQRVDRVQVNVTRLDTFETVSQHVGQGPEYYQVKEQWVAGGDGYEQLQTVLLQHGDVGFQMAAPLLAKALNRPFAPRSQSTAVSGQPKAPIKKKKRVLPPKGQAPGN